MTRAERLATLIDGRLDERRREEVLAELAASRDELEAYADAVAITAELEASQQGVTSTHAAKPERTPAPIHAAGLEGTPTRVTPLPAAHAEGLKTGVTPFRAPASRKSRVPRRWLALAAVLAAVALAPWLWTRFAAERGDPARLVAGGLPAGWEASPWGATRGAGDPLTRDARAVRLGARLVDLDLAVRGRHPETAALASETAALLDGIGAATPAARIYREVARRAGEPATELEPLLNEGREVVPFYAGEERVKLGSWVEAARIAAANRDRRFFASRATRSQLEQVARDSSLPASARLALLRVRTEVESSRKLDWTALERDLTALLRELGG
jgi:hypothetical protein